MRGKAKIDKIKKKTNVKQKNEIKHNKKINLKIKKKEKEN